ncbi:MAG TPA: hypothetical protein VMT80_00160 [Candidatus Paceibacterota bacterium]|nr:hypothetical protein [Candidatus Paceibacterota bacterium]
MNKRAVAISIIATLGFFLPAVSFASPLSSLQASAIVGLLQAFQVDAATVAHIASILGLSSPADDPPPAPVSIVPFVPPTGNFYPQSNLGYDISFATTIYPQPPFGFAVVGATRGKAFVHNDRFLGEFKLWSQFSSGTKPTFYLNLNAPYGSTAATSTMSAPKACAALFENANAPVLQTTGTASSLAAGASSAGTATYPEPTVCGSYNYGYNAAKDAVAYAKGNGATATMWWIDVEDANSWSENPAVNQAALQGAMDYLNSQGITAGIYSLHAMWNDIMGTAYTPPLQNVGGKSVLTPTWLPVGTATQVEATNDCNDRRSFIPTSPIWIIQYEADSTSVDQNIAC